MSVKKILLYSLFFLGWAYTTEAQKISNADLKLLRSKEDSLKKLAERFITDSLTAGRMRADSQFVKTFIRSLQVKNSFYYPFDSLAGVAKLYAPDSLFRIYTWNLSFDDYYHRQRGTIQFRTRDGSLRMAPLRDYSEFAENPHDSVRSARTWIGAVYYDIIKTEFKGKNFYTLIGLDANGPRTNIKWIEVLSFTEKNEPVFGGPLFSYAEDSIKKKTQFRIGMEYKKEARVAVEYDPEQQVIIFDHLISETDEPENKWTYVPDGDYEAFKWKNGQWVHIDKLYDFKLEDGQAPLPDPIRNYRGDNNEEKLKQKTDQNKQKEKGKPNGF